MKSYNQCRQSRLDKAKHVLGDSIIGIRHGVRPAKVKTLPLDRMVSRRNESVRSKRRFSSCEKKVRYCTEYEAARYAKDAMAKRGCALRVYYCSLCGGYHLTSKAN